MMISEMKAKSSNTLEQNSCIAWQQKQFYCRKRY